MCSPRRWRLGRVDRRGHRARLVIDEFPAKRRRSDFVPNTQASQRQVTRQNIQWPASCARQLCGSASLPPPQQALAAQIVIAAVAPNIYRPSLFGAHFHEAAGELVADEILQRNLPLVHHEARCLGHSRRPRRSARFPCSRAFPHAPERGGGRFILTACAGMHSTARPLGRSASTAPAL